MTYRGTVRNGVVVFRGAAADGGECGRSAAAAGRGGRA